MKLPGSLESGARSQESGVRSQEPGARRQEPRAWPDQQEPSAGIMKLPGSLGSGARSQESGARSQEQGARSQEEGARSLDRPPGARSRNHEGPWKPGVISWGAGEAARKGDEMNHQLVGALAENYLLLLNSKHP